MKRLISLYKVFVSKAISEIKMTIGLPYCHPIDGIAMSNMPFGILVTHEINSVKMFTAWEYKNYDTWLCFSTIIQKQNVQIWNFCSFKKRALSIALSCDNLGVENGTTLASWKLPTSELNFSSMIKITFIFNWYFLGTCSIFGNILT